jgi:hypothetical protein
VDLAAHRFLEVCFANTLSVCAAGDPGSAEMGSRAPRVFGMDGRAELDAEADPVPTHDRARPNDGEDLGPTAPEAARQDPEDPIGGPDVVVSAASQGGELLAQGQILDHEVASRAQG